jgi:predicted NAD/FAD-binding protein
MTESRLRIAVVGGGVAGIVSAYLLQEKYDVTLFEKNDYVGGHTHTITIDQGPDSGIGVDTGFIVLNNRTYPHFTRFLNRLGVPIRSSDMSFSFNCEKTGLCYAGNNLNGLFAQRRNIFKLSFHKMFYEIYRFGKEGVKDLKDGGYEPTLGRYLEAKKYSKNMIDDYLLPMGSAIWSTPPGEIWDFPTETFLKFFLNHGLLDLSDRPQWQTVVGGSHAYVKAFLKTFQGTVKSNQKIASIIRLPHAGVKLIFLDQKSEEFDKVVIAAHANEALALLLDPSELESRCLSPWQYQNNHTVLHTDISVMPAYKAAWASWNYTREAGSGPEGKTSLTYDMNLLQGLKTKRRYLVTLNRAASIDPKSIIREFNYTHPSYTLASVKTQKNLPSLNGVRNTYFCGSYFGYGFHEDAVKSAVAVAKQLGVDL